YAPPRPARRARRSATEQIIIATAKSTKTSPAPAARASDIVVPAPKPARLASGEIAKARAARAARPATASTTTATEIPTRAPKKHFIRIMTVMDSAEIPPPERAQLLQATSLTPATAMIPTEKLT